MRYTLDQTSRGAAIPWDYFALAYAISWAFWGLAWLVASGAPPASGTTEALIAQAPPAMLALVLLGVFGPFAAAFLLTWTREGRQGLTRLWRSGWSLRIPLRLWLPILFLFPALRIASVIVAGTGVSFEAFSRPLQLLGLTLFMYFLGGPFGEEFGWRGYALPRMLDRLGELRASLVLGAFWVVWHLPLFFIPGSPQAQIPFWPWAFSVLALSVLFTWVHIRVGGVVFAAILFHTMANLSSDLVRPGTGVGWADAELVYTILLVSVAAAVVIGWRRPTRDDPGATRR